MITELEFLWALRYVHHPLNSHIWTQSWDICFNKNMWMCRKDGKGCLRFSPKIRNVWWLLCVGQQSAGLTVETQELFTHGPKLLPDLCQVQALRQLCAFSDYITVIAIISSIQLIFFCLESWNWLLHFYFLSPPVHNCAFLVWKVWGNESHCIIIYQVSWPGENIPEMGVCGGGEI